MPEFHAAPKLPQANRPRTVIPLEALSYDRKLLMEMSEEILTFLGKLDPTWENRIEIVRDDMGLDALQTLGSLCAYALDGGAHTVLPNHPFFEPGYIPSSGVGICPICQESFVADYPNQPVCMKFACGQKFHGHEVPKIAVQGVQDVQAAEGRLGSEVQHQGSTPKGTA